MSLELWVPIIKEFVTPGVVIDNVCFKLHYKVAMPLLLACSMLVTARQYFGDPINCIADAIPLHVVDSYCWAHSTFTIAGDLDARVGVDVAHPGVGPRGTEHRHDYYQWVYLVLLLQSLAFYIPRHFWKLWEENVSRDLSTKLADGEVDQVVNFIKENIKHRHYNPALWLTICECLNLANVLAQMFFVNVFLGGEFTTFGLDVLSMVREDYEDRTDPMSRVFPQVSKCTIRKYGPSGTLEVHDAMCVLPINVANEKIFTAMWFCFVMLATASLLALVYRFTLLYVGKFRRIVFNQDLDYNNWFVVRQIRANVLTITYNEFAVVLAGELAGSPGSISLLERLSVSRA